MSTIIVKVIRVPGAVVEVGLNSGATVGDALAAANISAGENEQITLNGETVSMDTTVSDNARLVLAKSAKSA